MFEHSQKLGYSLVVHEGQADEHLTRRGISAEDHASIEAQPITNDASEPESAARVLGVRS
jgi:hypothetical protein